MTVLLTSSTNELTLDAADDRLQTTSYTTMDRSADSSSVWFLHRKSTVSCNIAVYLPTISS